MSARNMRDDWLPWVRGCSNPAHEPAVAPRSGT